MKDCGCENKEPVNKWLYEEDNLDNHISNFFSPNKISILNEIIQSRENFLNSNSLLNDELKEKKESVIKISKSEFTIKLESLML